MDLTKQDKISKHYGIKTVEGNFAIKDVDMSKRVVTGFYNAYNYFDSDSDVLIMGACKNSISQNGPNSSSVRKIKHALNHDLSLLPGKIQVLEETEKDGVTGLYFETMMSKSTLGNDTLINYQEGIYDNHSIGFRYLDLEIIDSDSKLWSNLLDSIINASEAEEAGEFYLIKEVMLYEGSTVAIGANELTPFLGVKSGNKDLQNMKLMDKISKIEKSLRKGNQSDDMLYNLSLQLRQVKQLINELQGEQKTTSIEPAKPDTATSLIKRLDNYQFFN